MKFLTGADLIEKLGIAAVDTMVSSADQACDSATLHLENDLRTPLSEATYSDIWMLKPGDFQLPNLVLKTTAAFIQAGTVKIGTGPTIAAARADTSYSSLAVVNYDQGLINIEPLTLSKYVSVRYLAGIPEGVTVGLFDSDTVPSWLMDAAKVKATQILANNPDLENKGGAILDAMDLKSQYGSMITARVRYYPIARNPLP